MFAVGLASWVAGFVCIQRVRRLHYSQRVPKAERPVQNAPAWQRRLLGAKIELLPAEARRLIIPTWVFTSAGALCIAIAIALSR